MKAVVLIAVNFVREQRWPILVLLLWVLLLAGFGLWADLRAAREDVLLVFKQMAVYGIAFAVFFGGSAIYSERKSRRILAVLSKAVGRRQYLCGLLAGITLACAIYCFALGLTGSWVLGDLGFPETHVWFLMLALLTASLLAATVAVLFSTFLNPFLAAGATAFVLAAPAVAAYASDPRWGYLLSVYSLMQLLLKSSFQPDWAAAWIPVLLGWSETAALALLASWIFAGRDIAVAVE